MKIQDLEIQIQLENNRKCVKLMNFFSALDTRFPTIYAKDHLRLITIVSLLRFISLLMIGIKLSIISILNGALPKFRYFLLDWTIINPVLTGNHQVRFMTTLCFLGLCVKRNIFFKTTMNAGILEFLVQDPRKIGDHKIVRNDYENKTNFEFKTDKLTRYIDNLKPFLEPRFNLERLKRYLKLFMGYPSQGRPREPIYSEQLDKKDFHTLENWLIVSREFARSFKRTCAILTVTHGGTVIYGCARVLLLTRRPPGCGECTRGLVIVALFETFVVYSEGIFCIIGLLAQVNTVVIYLSHQAAWTNKYLRNYIKFVDMTQNLNQSSRVRSGNRMMLQQLHTETWNSEFHANNIIDIKARSRTINGTRLYANNLRRRATSKYLEENQSNIDYKSISMLDTTPNRHNSNLDHDFEYCALRVCRKRVLELLHSVDEQKRLVTYMVTIKYISLFSKITVIPLILTIRHLGLSVARPLVGYVISGAYTLLICSKIAIDCANVNYATLQIAKLMFSICARYPDQPLQTQWSRIYYHWFFPVRCVFKVANFFDLTYLNLVKTISYVISAITIYLNYLTRFN